MTTIVRWCAQGKLSAHVHAVYPLAEIATALKAIADRKSDGQNRATAVTAASSRSRASMRPAPLRDVPA